MKYGICFLLLMMTITGCRLHRVFYWQPEKFDRTPEMIEIKVNPGEYTLYIRQLCTTDEEGKKTYQDCPPEIIDTQVRKLEVEYLFIQKNGTRVIYISNFPDKNEEVYEMPGFQFKDTVKVNARYFSKIYIGEIDAAAKKIKFQKSDKKSRVIKYETPDPENIRFATITEMKNNKTEKERLMTALNPVPNFSRQKFFYWMFNQYKADPADEEKPVRLVNNAIFIDKDKGIYFNLVEKWDDKKSYWIRYKSDRLATKIF